MNQTFLKYSLRWFFGMFACFAGSAAYHHMMHRMKMSDIEKNGDRISEIYGLKVSTEKGHRYDIELAKPVKMVQNHDDLETRVSDEKQGYEPRRP